MARTFTDSSDCSDSIVARCVRGFAGAIAVLAMVTSLHAAPALSGPSVVSLAQPVKFSGSGFSPNSAVTFAVRAPDGAEAHFSALVGADGSLSYSLVASQQGRYSLRVLNTAGAALSEVGFIAAP